MPRTLLTLLLAVAALAAPADPFSDWWASFLTAVAKNDAKAVATGATFPMNWENGPVREIKTEADFVKRFDFYFTPEIRKAIRTRKPERLSSGTYIMIWKARGNEYSLYFKPVAGSFSLDGLSEGPG